MTDEIEPYVKIGSRLKWIRETFSQDTSQSKYSTMFGWENRIYSMWEKGDRRITIPHAIKLCETYDLSLDFIYRGKTSVLPLKIAKLYLENQRTKK